jgi:hypothetical protein
MAERIESIDRFVKHVRERLNRHLWLDILIRCVGVSGAVLILLGLSYILRGYHVPLFWYPAVLGLALLVALGVWLCLRRSFDQAAQHTDQHFQLKDTVRSYEGFSKLQRQGGVYDLQAAHTEAALEKVSARALKYKWPTRLTLASAVLIVSSLLLTLKADSARIIQQRDSAEQVLVQTAQINAQIKEALEQIKEEAESEEVEKLIAPKELEKMVDELKRTSDLKDAMRQYAKLEKQLNTVLSKLEQRKDEQLYKKIGQVLQKQDQAKALGNTLVKRQYKEAAAELQKLKIDEKSSPENQRKQLEKLKSVAKAMANEAKQNNSSSKAASLAKKLDKAASNLGKALNSSSKGSGSQAPKGSQQGSQSSSSSGSSSESSNSQGSSAQGSGSQGSGSSGTGSEGSGSEGVNEGLSEMADNLNGLDAKCKAQSSIQSLCKSLSQCQGKLCDGSGQGQGQGQGKGNGSGDGPGGDGSGDGGRDPGTGSSSNTNANINNAASTGDKSVLKGIKGKGSSVKTTEVASDGSGSSSGSSSRLIKQYKHQAESFIRREDVSEAVKSGVKEYFESIHNVEEGN